MTTPDLAAKRTDTKNLLLCMGITALAMLLAWPLGEIGYADDFAYAHVALRLAQTGHFLYNGWEFAMLLSHAWWGALFIRLFGFSFTCLRLSTIPFALGSRRGLQLSRLCLDRVWRSIGIYRRHRPPSRMAGSARGSALPGMGKTASTRIRNCLCSCMGARNWRSGWSFSLGQPPTVFMPTTFRPE